MPTLKILPLKVDAGYSHQHGYQGDEAPAQTFPVGNLISQNANGQYQATPAGAAAVTAKNRIATAPGQNTANPPRRTEFTRPPEHGVIEITAGGTPATAALIKVGATYGYAIDAGTGYGYLNLNDTANALFRIEDNRLRRGDIGDTNVRVLVSFLPASV